MIDTRGELVQSAKDLRQTADKEKVSLSNVQHELDKIKQSVQTSHNNGVKAAGTEDLMYKLDRQVRDMKNDISNLERQARDLDKQSKRF